MVERILDPEKVKDGEVCFRFDNMEQLREFRRSLYDMINTRWWCHDHGIDYLNPNLADAAHILYNNMFSGRD